MRRTLLAATMPLAAAALLHGPALAAQAEAYPSRPIRFIVPFAPGGTNDIVARLVGAKMSESWGQSVVIDNRAGGGAVIGTEIAAKSPPDGYTLLMANVNFATNPGLMGKLPYDTLRDFAAVTLLATSPSVLVAHPSLGAKTVKDVIALAKAKPGQINYSTPGVGSTGHMAMELFKQLAKIDMTAVHYKGGGPALIDLLAGRVSPGFGTILSAIPHVQSGRLVAIAVSTPKRSPALPNVPTVAESGLPGYEFTGWWGVVVPTGTPQPVVAKLNAEMKRILSLPEVADRYAREGADPAASTPQEFAAYMRSEIAKWTKVIRDGNIKI